MAKFKATLSAQVPGEVWPRDNSLGCTSIVAPEVCWLFTLVRLQVHVLVSVPVNLCVGGRGKYCHEITDISFKGQL